MIGKGLPRARRDGRQKARAGRTPSARLQVGRRGQSVGSYATSDPSPFPFETFPGMSNSDDPAPPRHPSPPPAPPRLHDPTALPHTRIFTALLTDLQRSARRLARSGADADDLVQDTLLRVWSRMAVLLDAEEGAAPIEDLRAYAFATLRDRAFARYSIARPVDRVDQMDDIAAPRGSDGTARLACAQALAALADLPPEQQDLLRLRAIDGMSYADIAAKTGLPLGTVTSRLARGRATLRAALDLPTGTPVTELLGGSPK